MPDKTQRPHSGARGKCQRCGKEPRVLKTTDGGQSVCQTCWRELFPPRSKHLATTSNIEYLRKAGFDVPDDLPKEEARRLLLLNSLKSDGVLVPPDTPAPELERLSGIEALRRRCVAVADDATLAEINATANEKEAVKHFHARVEVAGFNPTLYTGDRLRVERRAVGGHDQNSVAVVLENGELLGWLRSDLSQQVANKMAQGWQYAALFKDVVEPYRDEDEDGERDEDEDGERDEDDNPERAVVLLVVSRPETTAAVLDEYVSCLARQLRGAAPGPTAAGQDVSPALGHFWTSVVGVAHANRDGTRRQEIVSRCSIGERLRVTHEMDNPVDRNAMAIHRQNGEQVGYLARDLAASAAYNVRNGWSYAAVIRKIRGSGIFVPDVDVALVPIPPGTSRTAAESYLVRLARNLGPAAKLAPEAEIVEAAIVPAVTHFCTDLADVTSNNRDGGSRQEIISRCRVWERLKIKQDKENPEDPKSVALVRENGEQVGYLKPDVAAEVSKNAAQGWRYAALVREFLPDGIDGTLGVVVVLIVVPPDTGKEYAREYISRLVNGATPV